MKFSYMWIAAIVFFLLTVVCGIGMILEFRKDPIIDGQVHPLLGLLGCLTFICLGVSISILIYLVRMQYMF